VYAFRSAGTLVGSYFRLFTFDLRPRDCAFRRASAAGEGLTPAKKSETSGGGMRRPIDLNTWASLQNQQDVPRDAQEN